ncbi:hypothetical protein [Nocardia goodfellowii]|uniref:PH domain-containing protein n=1 Tax=Nocardia goodfellowii TaxID=882446 RepID=A0ABS4QQC6_9NOCA|nr:hypothetical protein [Nocardia goodfellowii]MBP2193911.1 hypothetical protein [Nocardia goodfellowii]
MQQQQPVGQQSYPEQSAPRPDTALLIETTFRCDSATATRLSRAAALIAWRLPVRWGLLLVLPVFLLTRNTIHWLARGGSTTPGEIAGAAFAVLAVELVAVGVLTAVRMNRPTANIKAYSFSGARMSAQYTRDAMELNLVTQSLTHRYRDIRKVITADDVVYLQPVNTNGYVLPRELVPDTALTLLRSAQNWSPADPFPSGS